jgi:tetraacyldisaccharide 4'-kinase
MATAERYFRELLAGERQGIADRFIFVLLIICSLPYGLIIRLRAFAYELGIFTSHALDRPVISVGNLTVGGTGKTPTVAMLARHFIVRGKRVVVLSRGYGGTLHGRYGIVSDGETIFLTAGEAGDEPFLLASTVQGLAVVVGPDRYRVGLLAMERLSPDVFILDDGFQHLRLKRDLDILLLDSRLPFGNGRMLPAGILREPVSAARRADFIMYTRCSGGEDVTHVPGKPDCRSFHHLAGVSLFNKGELLPFAHLKMETGVAFAGIADPVPFFQDLKDEGLNLAATIPFPDHCRYGEDEVAEIEKTMSACGADYLITTEKDGVKLAAFPGRLRNLYTTTLELWVADPGPLLNKLENILVKLDSI